MPGQPLPYVGVDAAASGRRPDEVQDDVVARLYRPDAEREVLLDIARLVVADRD